MRLSLPSFFERRRGLLAVCLVVGIFVAGHYAYALDPSGIAKFLFTMLGQILGIIIAFLAKILIIAVDVLIAFASYNNFVHAQPVEIGWVLVRDVVNMFFIVVLLLSAFATIIQYRRDSFHYTKVLPKLLLMAILINFSKTLIGLMIDFSQVLMLTFVNAFKQAAGGNFVSALQLSQITTLNQSSVDLYDISELIPAAILGIMMLGISLTIIVIMLGFLIFRIIGLWLLLIMSPMAFFATALPASLGKAMTAFTTDYWGRLSSLLIMGPVMAFFLWLTLAIVQGNQLPFNDLLANNQEASSQAANFVTNVGDASHIAVFIVVVALLLQGVEFAVKTAGAISPTFGNLAKATAAGGGVAAQLARLTARGTGRAARVAGRAAGAVGGAAFEGVDRLADVRGRVGKIGLAVSKRTGGIGAATFAGLATAKSRRVAAGREEFAKGIKDLDAGSQMKMFAAKGDDMRVAEMAMSGVGIKALTKEKEKGLSHITNEKERKLLAEGLAKREAGSLLQKGMSEAERVGNEEKITKYQEALKKDPSLNSLAGAGSLFKGMGDEERNKYVRESMKADAFKDSGVALAMMSNIGLFDKEGKATEVNEEFWKASDKAYGEAKTGMLRQHYDYYKNNQDQAKTQIQAINGDDSMTEAGNKARAYVGKGADGRMMSMQLGSAAPQVNVQQAFNVRNEEAIGNHRKLAEDAEKRNDSETAGAHRLQMAGQGASLAEAFKFDPANAVFEKKGDDMEFYKQMSNLDQALASDDPKHLDAGLDTISRFDTASLALNQDGYNAARVEAVAALKPETILKASRAAAESGNKPAQKKLGELLDIMSKEGKRVEKATNKAGISREEIAEVSLNPRSGRSQQIIQRMESAGIVEPVQSARAATKAWDVESRPELRAMRSSVPTSSVSRLDKAAKAQAGVATLKEKRAKQQEQKFDTKVAKVDAKAEARQARVQAAAERMEKKLGGKDTV